MLRITIPSAWVVLAALGTGARLGAQVPVLPFDFKWGTDLEAARKAALTDGKPLLIVFR
jgi:hypothetical protein